MDVGKRSAGPRVYEIKVTLDGSTPAIWRRLRVMSDVSLARLHRILQLAMGWGGLHHHQFIARGRYYGRPDRDGDVRDERRIRLGEVAPRVGARITYEYDLGEGWMHEVAVEKIAAPTAGTVYPVCLGGERACPPENVGGINGYYDLLDALQDAACAGHERALEWVGGHFEPDAFDLETVNRRLRLLSEQPPRLRP